VQYNQAMDTTKIDIGPAPVGVRYKLGGKGGQTYKAWERVWAALGELDEDTWVDGAVLTEKHSGRVSKETLRVVLSKMVTEGHLERRSQAVTVDVARPNKNGTVSEFQSTRSRTHYRINRTMLALRQNEQAS